jgi:hypothetical protein
MCNRPEMRGLCSAPLPALSIGTAPVTVSDTEGLYPDSDFLYIIYHKLSKKDSPLPPCGSGMLVNRKCISVPVLFRRLRKIYPKAGQERQSPSR